MARSRAFEKRLLDLIEQEPRFLFAGPAASFIWLKLVLMMAQMGDPSVLTFGSVFGSWSEVAHWLRVSETELVTHLETLAGRGLVALREDGLAIPELIGVRDRRAEAARANGEKGGRPRKNAPVQGQTTLKLPIAGGADGKPTETKQETQADTQAETPSRARLLSPENQDLKEREEGADLVSLTAELVAIGGLDPAQRHNPRVVQGWLDSGATPELLRRAFREVAARANAPGRGAPLTYFGGAVADLVEAERCGRPEPQTSTLEDPAVTKARAENRAMWDRFIANGRVGRCPPTMAVWLKGDLPDANRWIRYIEAGDAVFREVV